jgi:hypothetical protein
VGIGITTLAAGHSEPGWTFVEHIGIFFSATISVTLLYEIIVKRAERKIFLHDIQNIVRDELRNSFHVGRKSTEQKIKFISVARKEVIEMGEKLNSFSSYFISRSEHDFKNHIKKLLDSGITLKCILCNPDSEAVIAYSKSNTLEETPVLVDGIRESIDKLKKVRDEFRNCSGKIEIYLYDGVMKFHMSGVDIKEANGKMFISTYLNGVSRSNCPGFDVYNEQKPKEFRQYLASYNYIIAHSKLIN